MKNVCVNDTALLDASQIPTWIYCPDTLRFMVVNEAAVAAYGYSKEQFAQMTIADIRPPEDVDSLLEDIEHHVKQDIIRSSRSRWRHRRSDGSIFYVQLFSSYIEYNNQPARMVQAIDIDEQVIEQQKSEDLDKMLHGRKDDVSFLLSSMNEVVWIAYADDFQLLYTNAACEKVHGYTAAEMMADKTIFYRSIHPKDIATFGRSMQTLMQTGIVEQEFRIIHKDGSIHCLKGTALLRKGINGARDICCGITIDITELKEEQHKNEHVLNSITDGFFVLDKDWNFTYANHAYKNMFGHRGTTTLRQNYWELFPLARTQKFFTEYHRAVKEGVSVHFEELATSLGKWVLVSAYPTGSGLAVYFTDITEQHKLKEELLKQEHNLYALINNTKDMIWSVDKDLNMLSLNTAYQTQIFNYTGRLVQPGEPAMLPNIPQAYIDEWMIKYKRGLMGERFKTIDCYETLDNIDGYWETSFNPILDGAGNIMGVSCFCTDITEERNHMIHIELQNIRLKEIAHIQSHQVRGPVATILGLTALIDPDCPNDPDNSEVLQGIITAANTLDDMVRDITKKTHAIWPEA